MKTAMQELIDYIDANGLGYAYLKAKQLLEKEKQQMELMSIQMVNLSKVAPAEDMEELFQKTFESIFN